MTTNRLLLNFFIQAARLATCWLKRFLRAVLSSCLHHEVNRSKPPHCSSLLVLEPYPDNVFLGLVLAGPLTHRTSIPQEFFATELHFLLLSSAVHTPTGPT